MNRRAFIRSAAGIAASSSAPSWSFAGDARAADVQASAFDAEAFRILPVEEPYAFVQALASGVDPELGELDPLARPTAEEMGVPVEGYNLVIPSGAGEPLSEAAERLQRYLEKSMRTRVNVVRRPSLTEVTADRGAIIAGARDQLPGHGQTLKSAKDYQIVAAPQRVVVCGYDEAGAMYGLYNLMERFSLRQAPILPRNLNTVRYSLYKARITHSGIGWMDWPDEYLAMLARYGFDSIYGAPYANPNGVHAPDVYGNHYRDADPAAVHDLIRRAARFGLKLYCQMMYNYLGTPESAAGLRKLMRDIVTEFPEVRGYILLSEGFYPGVYSWHSKDLREWLRQWAEGVGIVTDVCHKINPAIEVLAWEYNIDSKPDKIDLKKYLISQLPKDCIPMFTFEMGKSFTFDGETGYLKDYAISQVGPSEVTAAQIQEARKQGFRDVYSKADTWATWQLGTTPYLPFPYQWHARDKALEEYGITGTMESWTYGFKPNFVAEVRAWHCWSDAPPLDTLLGAIARRDFGAGTEDLVLDAWKHFSKAIQLNPDTGHTAGGANAVADPFFFEKPEPRTFTLEHAFLDAKKWADNSYVNPYWPYVQSGFGHGGYILFPDFTNQINVAEDYAKPLSLPVFRKYLLLAADEMANGLASYRKAALVSPPAKRHGAFRMVLVAEQIERMFRCDSAMLEFEDHRFRLAKTEDQTVRRQILDRMVAILKEEIPRTNAALETARRDSRLGYEPEMDYLYSPYTIRQKLEVLQTVLDEEIPAYRKRYGISN